MRGIRSKASGLVKGLLAVILVLGVVIALPAKTALADDEAVRSAANGVMKFNWYDPDGNAYQRGSCFLINEDTVITAYHCTFWSTAELDAIDKMRVASGEDVLDRRWLKEHMTYSVNVNRDMQIGATLVNRSEEQDFAIFKLDQSIAGYTPLSFRDSSTVAAAEAVYSVGFPSNGDLSVIQRYTPSDATVKGGTVSKAEDIYQGSTIEGFHINGYFIQSDCAISGGDSGGPMVDANGNVIGISVWGDGNYYFAVASDRVMEALDTLKISYPTPNSTPTPKPDEHYTLNTTQLSGVIDQATKIPAEGYTEESYAALRSAITAATKVRDEAKLDDDTDKEEYDKKTQEIDDAKASLEAAMTVGPGGLVEQKETGLPMWAIIAIIAGLAVLIGIIVAIVLINKNKKKAATVAPTPQPQPQTPPTPTPAVVTVVTDDPATTVLDEGSEGTTILGEQINGGRLTRMSTNEQIPISRSEMTLGRERKSVDYCLDGNGNIGRVHARIVVRDGSVYIVDNNSTNGTYVNNTKLRSGQEQVLHDNDIVKLADEKFRYTS